MSDRRQESDEIYECVSSIERHKLENILMNKLSVQWEYVEDAHAENRLLMAFEMIGRQIKLDNNFDKRLETRNVDNRVHENDEAETTYN